MKNLKSYRIVDTTISTISTNPIPTAHNNFTFNTNTP